MLVPPGSHTPLSSLPQKSQVIHLPAPTLISQILFNFSQHRGSIALSLVQILSLAHWVTLARSCFLSEPRFSYL